MIAPCGLLGEFYGVSQAEYDALMAFYVATDGPNWTNNSGWGVDPNVDAWFGVTVAGGVVTILSLNSNNLAGNAGTTLSPLVSMVTLSIANNSLTGIILTDNVAITNLSIHFNNIGTLTTTTLVDLAMLNCADCGLSAITGLALNTKLVSLIAHENNFGTLDLSTNVLIYNLGLRNCGLSAITGLSDLTLLRILVVAENSFVTISFASNPLMTHMDLQFNSLDGLTTSETVAVRFLGINDNGMTEAEIDAILLDAYTNRATYTSAGTIIADISGTNAAPSGTYQYSATPSTGKEYAYALENDDDAEGFTLWTIAIA